MHTGPIPVKIFAQWFWMPFYIKSIFFCSSFRQVTCNPNLVAGAVSTFGKNLKFPLSGSNFSPVAAQNVVLFSGMRGSVVGASSTELRGVVPA